MDTKERFSVRESIEHAVRLLEDVFASNEIQLRVSYHDKVYIHGYKNEYSQVILNILQNAKDALVSHKIVNPCIQLDLKLRNKMVVVSIVDNGPGIADSDLEKIFEPYFTTKGQSEGSGLGLYMCKMIIEKNMNGKITVKNLSKGVRFLIKNKLHKYKEER